MPRWPEMTLEERFWSKVNKEGPIPDCSPGLGPCWIWMGVKRPNGYGTFHVNRRRVGAHRFSWELTNGKIPDGLELDHLCRIRWCVNPKHLEPVTRRVNFLRGESKWARTHITGICQRGHKALRVTPAGTQACIECIHMKNARRKKL